MTSEKLQGKRILIIDDDPGLSHMLSSVLSQEGAEVITAYNGQDGLRLLFEQRPHLVFLDIMMHDLDGWQVCRQIRQLSDVPIIIISALSQDKEIVLSLDVGADDFITKPFSRLVLLARTQAALRRAALPPISQKATGYKDNYLILSLENHQVLVRGKPVRLTATEYNLLAYLVKHMDQVCTFPQILRSVWGEEYRDSAEYVHTYIRNLRKKLEPDPHKPIYIITEHTVGYRFASYPSTTK